MKYQSIQQAVFQIRLNRFVAKVLLDGEETLCHVKNTGRCRELLVPGAVVYLETCLNPMRKTKYDLVAVQKGSRLINMDSQAPNQAVYEWLKQGNLIADARIIRPESAYRHSRFDFYVESLEHRAYIEVKGVTLEKEGVVLFPDAPTLRGVKHIKELCNAREEGYEAYLIFVIQMEGVTRFLPNRETQPDFADALLRAQKKGVHILAYDCRVLPEQMTIRQPVPVCLEEGQSV